MTRMSVRAVPDGKGGFRHEPTPYVPPARKGKRAGAAEREPMKAVSYTHLTLPTIYSV